LKRRLIYPQELPYASTISIETPSYFGPGPGGVPPPSDRGGYPPIGDPPRTGGVPPSTGGGYPPIRDPPSDPGPPLGLPRPGKNPQPDGLILGRYGALFGPGIAPAGQKSPARRPYFRPLWGPFRAWNCPGWAKIPSQKALF
jgi:hypothetical protein